MKIDLNELKETVILDYITFYDILYNMIKYRNNCKRAIKFIESFEYYISEENKQELLDILKGD